MPLERETRVYRHTQSTPATTWTIAHGLGSYPVIDVYITADGVVQKILPLSVSYVNENTASVTFTTAQAGFATVLV